MTTKKREISPLRHVWFIKKENLTRPTFVENFDVAVIDWRYLRWRERVSLQEKVVWGRRKNLEVVMDLSSSVNL